MFVRVLFVLVLALSLNRAAVLEFRTLGAGHWSYPREHTHETAPPRHATGEPLVVVQAPPIVALVTGRTTERERSALIAGAFSVLPLALWQWLTPRLPSIMDALGTVLRPQH